MNQKNTAVMGGAFNAFDFDPSGGSSQLPIGRHLLAVTDAEVTGTKNNNQNGMVVFDVVVLDGEHKGATGQYRLNLYHQNQQACDIAKRQLSALAFVVGVPQFSNFLELKDRPFWADVGPQKDNPQYTEIKKIYSQDGKEPAEIKAALMSGQQAAQATNGGNGFNGQTNGGGNAGNASSGFGGGNGQGNAGGFGGGQNQTAGNQQAGAGNNNGGGFGGGFGGGNPNWNNG